MFGIIRQINRYINIHNSTNRFQWELWVILWLIISRERVHHCSIIIHHTLHLLNYLIPNWKQTCCLTQCIDRFARYPPLSPYIPPRSHPLFPSLSHFSLTFSLSLSHSVLLYIPFFMSISPSLSISLPLSLSLSLSLSRSLSNRQCLLMQYFASHSKGNDITYYKILLLLFSRVYHCNPIKGVWKQCMVWHKTEED